MGHRAVCAAIAAFVATAALVFSIGDRFTRSFEEPWEDFLARHEWQLCEVVRHGVPPTSHELAPEARAARLKRALQGAFHEGEHFYCVASASFPEDAPFAMGRDADAFRAWAAGSPDEILWVPYVDGDYRELPSHVRTTEDFADDWFRLEPQYVLAILVGCDYDDI